MTLLWVMVAVKMVLVLVRIFGDNGNCRTYCVICYDDGSASDGICENEDD